MMNNKRRILLKGMAAATAAIPFSHAFSSTFSATPGKNYPIAIFTKPLDNFELEFMAETLAMSGIDGFDLSVRPKGRVEPARVTEELPKAIEMGKKHNLSTPMMVTAITDSQDINTERVLKCAASLGIKHYRLGYYDYDVKKGIRESLVEIKKKIESLAKLNKAIGIQGGYQNHSGTKVGAPLWDVSELLQNVPVEFMSSQFDVRHAVTEGASSWILAMQLLRNNIGSLAIKDFTWDVTNHKAKVVSVPLGEGIVDFDLFFNSVKEMNLVVPLTLHVEYPLLDKEEEKLSLLQKQKIIVSKIKKDVEFIRTKLAKFQLV
jgi:L-ribulose-5-phosphate 3-epimerase